MLPLSMYNGVDADTMFKEIMTTSYQHIEQH